MAGDDGVRQPTAPPDMTSYVVKAKNGAIVRKEKDLASAQVDVVPAGADVAVAETVDGRCRLTAPVAGMSSSTTWTIFGRYAA